MKSRFTTIDICAVITDLQRYIGMRVNNVYDIDNKTYLIRLVKPDHKIVLLIESGLRIHSTEFEWPKNMFPSGFAMKLRKHISGKRLVKLSMLGVDRILDLQFGSNEVAHHLIVELYDRGNIVLTDYEYTILNLLRTRTDNDDVRFAVRERYPVENAKQFEPLIAQDKLQELLLQAKPGDVLKKVLNPNFVFGPALLDHCLSQAGFPVNAKLESDVKIDQDISKIMEALHSAEKCFESAWNMPCKGYITMKKEKKPGACGQSGGSTDKDLLMYQEFHPFLFDQHKDIPHVEFDSFNKAVDEFFSKIESQKLDTKALQQEKAVLKKLDNVKKDHEKRLDSLQKAQEEDVEKARLIEINLPQVDQAIKVVNSAIANQIDWAEINNIVKEAQTQGDSVAMAIKQLKLEKNHITMMLKNQGHEDSSDSENENGQKTKNKPKVMKVDIDLALTAYANARSYYTKKRQAATKEQKTVEASKKALKSAEKKTKETLKEVATTTSIRKARKVYWFEKFFWFISSENYLVIGGRDQQQNEVIVKRHLKPGDIYVHADLHGASSVIIKNHGSEDVPPKTLNEAGCMAVCYSSAWNDRVITSAWWVYHHQVSKTAPTGEYLTTGSFMIRGKKNFLPPSYLILGFGFIFRLDETCVEKHLNERKPKSLEEEAGTTSRDAETDDVALDDEELQIEDGGSDGSDEERNTKSVETERPEEDEEDAGQKRDIKEDEDKDLERKQDEEENVEKKRNKEIDKDVDKNKDNESSDDQDMGNEKDVGEDDETLGVSYPDTSIDLKYKSGGKFQLECGTSYSSTQGTEDFVDLGDGQILDLRSLGRSEQGGNRKQRLSAKQRRQLRKKGAPGVIDENNSDDFGSQRKDVVDIERSKTEMDAGKTKQPMTQQNLPKRGKKGKLKKIKEKYGDQDEEDRQLMMQILGSAGPPKENKGKKKNKDAKERKGSAQSKQGERGNSGKSIKQGLTDHNSKVNKTNVGNIDKLQDISRNSGTSKNNEVVAGEAPQQISGTSLETLPRALREGLQDDNSVESAVVVPETEDISTKSEEIDEHETESEKDSLSLLDSLTGCPFSDDITLFAIPVCAPYSSMQNYKYKVKLTPGTGRRGKAARTALHSFIQSRETTAREKDLLKSVKDADLSRYIPGKVKISAPSLHKK